MKVNGIDARKYNAKQLSVEVQPPLVAVNYEWIKNAIMPTEFKTDIELGHVKIQVYFRGKDRNSIIRSMSEFMGNFTKSCDLELDGYKGKFRGFMTADDFEKTGTKRRYKLNIEFDGYFYDDELEILFDGVSSGSFFLVGSRKTPCIVEVYAKKALTNYKISGFGSDDIIIESLAAGKAAVIDGAKGIVTVDGENAFDKINLWEFPAISTGETTLMFSNTGAKVSIRYKPMWI
ncbi:phage distal tail protein [Eisenbergiella sp.]